jgi:gliding motility-associated-like protein
MKALCNAYGVHLARCKEHFLCLSISFSLCMLFSFSGHAQDIKLTNPSMEGPTSEGHPPPDWISIEKTPDTQPGVYNISLKASEGSSYVGMLCNSQLQEGITQQLAEKLDSGKTYYLSFDLAYAPLYSWKVAYGSLVIYGGDTLGERKEILWKSGAFYNQDWKKFTAVFTPSRNYAYLVFSPYKVEKDNYANVAGVMIDNLSAIKEAIKLDLVAQNTCQGASNGGVTVKVLNADDKYTYLWEPSGDTVNSLQGLPAGKYQVSVRSKSGATTYGTIEVNTYNVQATVSVVPIKCAGDKDGIISVDAKGGQPPYTYYLNEETGARFSNIINGIGAGKYMVKAEDRNGCAAILDEVVLTEPAALKLSQVVTTSVTCNGSEDGEIIIMSTGGTLPYSYSVSGKAEQSDNTVRHMGAGIYHYSVTDGHKCILEGNAEIAKEWRDCAVFVPNAFSPNGDGLNDLFRVKVQDNISDFNIRIYGRWGQLVYESRDAGQGWDGMQKGTYLPTGSYIWVITYTDSKHQGIKEQGALVLIK